MVQGGDCRRAVPHGQRTGGTQDDETGEVGLRF